MTRILTIIALLFATPAWAEMVLYCQDELATGIFKEKGSWRSGHFITERHTVKFDEKKMTLLIKVEKFSCSAGEGIFPDSIRCVSDRNADFHFLFNKKTLRYSMYRMFETSWVADGTDTTWSSHGTCQKF